MHLKFLLRPKWIAGHIIVIVMVTFMVLASHWQWSRLQDRKETNAATSAAMAAGPRTIENLDELDSAPEYRPVKATGTWDMGKAVYVRYPIFNSAQGYYVLVPLTLASGEVVTVNRGWISQEAGIDDSPAPASQQEVTVTGFVRKETRTSDSTSQTKGSPPVSTVTSVDSAELAKLFGASQLGSNYVQLQTPAGEGDPQPLPAPDLNEGSHWSYTLQWAAFALLTVIGYAILLRRARQDVIADERGESVH